MKNVATTVGRHLRSIREAQGLSQFDVAVRAGWHISKVRRIEGGSSSVTLHDLLAYSRALSLSVCSVCPVETECDHDPTV